jgi:hypothetical protein
MAPFFAAPDNRKRCDWETGPAKPATVWSRRGRRGTLEALGRCKRVSKMRHEFGRPQADHHKRRRVSVYPVACPQAIPDIPYWSNQCSRQCRSSQVRSDRIPGFQSEAVCDNSSANVQYPAFHPVAIALIRNVVRWPGLLA